MIPESILLYDAHHARYKDDISFWLGLAEAQGGPVLELGCGSGRVLIPLAEAGFDVFGLDLDIASLALLKSRLTGPLSKRAAVFQGDMAAFCLEERFALVMLPCNTLSTLSREVLGVMLENVGRQMAPGGRFVASMPNPVLFEKMMKEGETELEDAFTHPVTGNPVQVSSSWQRSSGIFTVSWHYDQLLPDGLVRRTTVQAGHNPWLVAEYMEAFRSANLSLEAAYGDFDRRPYRASSKHLILVVSKLNADKHR